MDTEKRHTGACKPEVGRGCAFCNCGSEPEAKLCDGCFKLHETAWLDEYPVNMPSDIVEVRFKNTRRAFYQNVNNLPLKRGDIVAVEASPGHDIGIVSLTGDMVAKQMKRTGTVAMCRLDNNTVLEKGLYYYQGNDFASELVYSISRLCEPCLEHIDNNFNPLDAIQKGEFSDVSEDITYLIQQCRKKMENNEYNDMEEEVRRANDLNGQLSLLKRKELQRIQSQAGSIRVSMVYLTMVQEAQNVVTYTINLMKVSRKFQVETEMP